MRVEAYDADENLIFAREFDALPRVGEHVALMKDGYFWYYDVIRVWYRDEGPSEQMQACLQVKLDD